MDGNPIVLDGALDEEVVLADPQGTAVLFRLILSPTDEIVDETVLACRVDSPALVQAVAYAYQPGDQLRVTGYLYIPQVPDYPLRLEADRIELLQEAPARSPEVVGGADEELDFLTADPADIYQRTGISIHVADCGLFERHGTYLLWHDGDVAVTSVWTRTGAWVGETDDPDRIGDLIAGYERRPADG